MQNCEKLQARSAFQRSCDIPRQVLTGRLLLDRPSLLPDKIALELYAHIWIEVVVILFLRCSQLLLFLSLFIHSFRAFPDTSIATQNEPEYRLRFYHTHTGERLDVVYRRGDTYDSNAESRINQYLRDYRTDDIREYDPSLFDLLHDLMVRLGRPDGEIDVVCGYRTPRTNEYLRTHGRGVARHSLHMQAMAIDIRIPGVPTAKIRDTALAMRRGGVGYYAASDFVHVDVGRVRRW